MDILDLSPYERRNEYFKTVQLGSDVKTQNKLIAQAAKLQLESQLYNTDRIIASNDRISSYIEELSHGIDGVVEGISELKATFEWGISEVVWQIEQNRKELESINAGIWHPFDAAARNKKELAQKAFDRGWFGDAEKYFLDSENIISFDFSVHISLGMIYLFHKVDRQKALSYFDKAIIYAKPESNYYTSYALLYKSLILFDFGKVREAEQHSQEAIDLSPTFVEAYYQNAQYNSKLGNFLKAINRLEFTINNDRRYALKAEADDLFDPMKSQILDLIIKKAAINYGICKNNYNTAISLVAGINSLLAVVNSKVKTNIQPRNFEAERARIDDLFNRNTFFDSFDAIKHTDDLRIQIRQYCVKLKDQSFSLLSSYELEVKGTSSGYEKTKDRSSNISGTVLLIVGSIISMVIGYRSCNSMLAEGSRQMMNGGTGLGNNLGGPLVFIIIVIGGAVFSYWIGSNVGSMLISSQVSSTKINSINEKHAVIKRFIADLNRFN